MDSDMDISFAFCTVHLREANLSKNNCTIGCRGTSDLNKTRSKETVTYKINGWRLTETKSSSMVKLVRSSSEIPLALRHILGS